MTKQEMLDEMLNMYILRVGPSNDGYNGTDVPKTVYVVFEAMVEIIKLQEKQMIELTKDMMP